MGVLKKVNISEWRTLIEPVIKPSDTIRLCGDYKITVNPQLQVMQYPLPHPEQLFVMVDKSLLLYTCQKLTIR